jgi:DNA-binding CsgD family transcriptional regulator
MGGDILQSNKIAFIVGEVDKICGTFIYSRGIDYFQFKRVFKDSSYITLANHSELFDDFLGDKFLKLSHSIPFLSRQLIIYSWDEAWRPNRPSIIINSKKLYHAITFISRRKKYFDCTTFAMSKNHLSPFSYYFNILKELQQFAEIFPTLASSIIGKLSKEPFRIPVTKQNIKSKKLFLPKRSTRFRIGEGVKDYITTYEALCLQLSQEGKSYKEIGSILSMSTHTVETHLCRLKERTGLTTRELSLRFLHSYNTVVNSKKDRSSDPK